MKNLNLALLKLWYLNLHIVSFIRAHFLTLGWQLCWCNSKFENILGTPNQLFLVILPKLEYPVYFQFWSYINVNVTLKSGNELYWMVEYVSFDTTTLTGPNSSFSFSPLFSLVLYIVKIRVPSIFSFLKLHQNTLHPKVTYG